MATVPTVVGYTAWTSTNGFYQGVGGNEIQLTVSTGGTNRLLVAFMADTTPGDTVYITGISGGGLTWNKLTGVNSYGESSLGGWGNEVWWAIASTQLTSQTITGTANAGCDGGMIIIEVKDFDPNNPFGAWGKRGSNSTTTTNVAITPQASNSLILSVFNGGNGPTADAANNSLIEFRNLGDVYYTYKSVTAPIQGVSFTSGATSTDGGVWTGLAIEILAPASAAPIILDGFPKNGISVATASSCETPAFDAPAGSRVVVILNGEQYTWNVTAPTWVGGTPSTGTTGFTLQGNVDYNDGWYQWGQVYTAEVGDAFSAKQITYGLNGANFTNTSYSAIFVWVVVGASGYGIIGSPPVQYPTTNNEWYARFTGAKQNSLLIACASNEDGYPGASPSPTTNAVLDSGTLGSSQAWVLAHTVPASNGNYDVGVTANAGSYNRSIGIELLSGSVVGFPVIGFRM